ncbi:MAG: cell division protein ZapE [Gammaproteobacteria bacterium SHHR-1]|uniref:cell division protein ZapE n=1 Tax=Magnetovirga frankeli TaxID=947516 RepID=UPI001293508B|nr:AFG1 family ATPase [gamma proteobacterium SS-5]
MTSIEQLATQNFPQHQIDRHQRQVLAELEGLRQRLSPSGRQSNNRSWRFWRKPQVQRGLYLWGGVGRGKTWLMDLFYDSLGELPRQRLHFHRFMQQTHAAMGQLQGRANPLGLVAGQLAGKIRLLCLDEFSVIDIADAVILAGLLRGLFEQGICLVTTSNQPPELLYRGGIQRASFLPAIDLLQRHTQVLELNGSLDYRRRLVERAGVYHWPLGEEAEACLRQAFAQLQCEPLERDGQLSLLSREVTFRLRSGGLIWFDFDALCGPPRSQYDYIELARQQHTVFISDIPRLDGSSDDRARRFILLVDEFYDRGVKLMASASVAPESLYCGERLAFEFQRTASRLQEMQTADYLSRPHVQKTEGRG